MSINKSTLVKDSKIIGLLMLAAYVVMQIAFYKENVLVVARTIAGLFYIFVLPLLPLTYVFLPQVHIYTRLLVSTGLSWSAVTLTSYYAGLSFLSVNNHAVLPLALFIISCALLYVSSSIVAKKTSSAERI